MKEEKNLMRKREEGNQEKKSQNLQYGELKNKENGRRNQTKNWWTERKEKVKIIQKRMKKNEARLKDLDILAR